MQRCYHYRFNNTQDCTSSYTKCKKLEVCPSIHYNCFIVWEVVNSTISVISAGCNPPFPTGSNPSEKCEQHCIGQPRGQKYYCCCSDDSCNYEFQHMPPTTTPKPAISPGVPGANDATHALWYVIPLVLISTLVGIAYVYRHRQNKLRDRKKRNCKGEKGNRNASEMVEMRNHDHLAPFLRPFRNPFGEERNNNNTNDHNLNQNNINNRTPSNNHDSNNHFNRQLNDKKIDLSSIKLMEIIGSGRFGTVHRATLNDEEIAVKIISSNDYHSWLNEHLIYNSPRIKHPNILHYFFSHEHFETESYWLVVEHASKGSLHSFLKENTMSWKEFLHIALGIAHGLSHLHEADIAHRDFKSKNVLLKQDLTPCITDLGVACILDGSQSDDRKKYLQVGTPRYMAPEVLECSVTFTKASFTKIDVYALSLVLWELISRCHSLPKSPHMYNSVGQGIDQPDTVSLNVENGPMLTAIELAPATEQEESQKQSNECILPPYKLPFEDAVGSNPDINEMRQIVVVEKLRPILRDEWRAYPASVFCRAIEDGWEYDHDARISASCFVERVESLQQIVQ